MENQMEMPCKLHCMTVKRALITGFKVSLLVVSRECRNGK